MQFGGKLLRQTFLSYFLLLCLGIAAVALYASNRFYSLRLEGQEHVLLEESRLLFGLIDDDLHQKRIQAVRDKLKLYSHTIDCRITVIDAEGVVIVDTDTNPDLLENHRVRPEIVAAAASGEGSSTRLSHTFKEEMLYLARREHTADGATYFVRLALPMTEVNRKIPAFDNGLAMTMFATMLFGGAICLWRARRKSGAILQLAQLSESMAHGDLERRAHVDGGGEFQILARNLNAIGASLAESKSKAAKGQAELDNVLGSMSDGLIATDPNQRILLVNRATETLFNFSSEKAAGKMLWEVLQDEAILKAATQVGATGLGVVVQSSTRQGKHIEVAISPLIHGNRNEGVLIVARDATQTIQYQDLRKEFVANVSHELRTPLTIIKGYIETLNDGALNTDKAPQFLNTVEKHVNQLTNLVDDLLEISKLESRTGLPRRVKVSVADMIHKAVDLLAPAAAKKNQSLNLVLPPDSPFVLGDPGYLERAVSNLIGNAIKYTPPDGSISVSSSTQDDMAVIEVSDTGIGIPAEDLPRIFERFYRVDKSRSRDMGGTGLGLAIVKHIVQVHEGTVEVASTPGKGTRFRMLFHAVAEY